MTPQTDTQRFLEAVFFGKPKDLYVLVWTLPEKQSYWFTEAEAAIRFVESQADRSLYLGVGLSGKDYGPEQRCKADETAGILGFWIDIDLRSQAHDKAALPKTIEQALSILPPDLPPTVIVLTGNGIHAWWLFREPWIFESDEERNEAAAQALRFTTLIRDAAAQHGWAIDRLADLARVLRIPGTTNCKDPDDPKPITIHSISEVRYNPSDIEGYLDMFGIPDAEAEHRTNREWQERFKDKTLIVNPGAEVSAEQLQAWQQSDDRFLKTWYRQRGDLRDQSQSGYDMALANFGIKRELPYQTIVDLIVHHRRIYRQRLRNSLDYFQRTISKAENANSQFAPAPNLNGSQYERNAGVQAHSIGAASETADRTKAQHTRQVSAALGIEILRIVKITGDEPTYSIELTDGKISFPNVTKLMSQKYMRDAVAAHRAILIPHFRPKDWDHLCQLMLDSCVEIEGGEELRLEGKARLLLRAYLADSPAIDSPEGKAHHEARRPLIYKEGIAICIDDFQAYVLKTLQQNPTIKEVASMLHAFGAEPFKLKSRKFKEQSRWLLPVDEFHPDELNAAVSPTGDLL